MAYSKPGASKLRKGRYSQPGHYYFLTTSVAGRRKIFAVRSRGETPLPRTPLPRGSGLRPRLGIYRGETPLPQGTPLPQQDLAVVVLDAIRWLHASDRFVVDAAVVMPDHLHFVGQLGKGSRQDAPPTLAKVMHTLKSYSAHRLAAAGVEVPVWQDGFHDHGLRDDEDYRVKVQYVLQNPVRAGLVGGVEEYPYVILPDWWG